MCCRKVSLGLCEHGMRKIRNRKDRQERDEEEERKKNTNGRWEIVGSSRAPAYRFSVPHRCAHRSWLKTHGVYRFADYFRNICPPPTDNYWHTPHIIAPHSAWLRRYVDQRLMQSCRETSWHRHLAQHDPCNGIFLNLSTHCRNGMRFLPSVQEKSVAPYSETEMRVNPFMRLSRTSRDMSHVSRVVESEIYVCICCSSADGHVLNKCIAYLICKCSHRLYAARLCI